MNIIKYKNLFFIISLVIMIPGIIGLYLWGLQLSIDFTGGTRLQYLIQSNNPQQTKTELQKIVTSVGGTVVGSIQTPEKNTYALRMKSLTRPQYQNMQKLLRTRFPEGREVSFETVGPTVGSETTWNAFKAVGVAILLIVLYIAWSFRNVPKPASSWRFGICTIAALVHDVIVVVGIFAILGHFYGVEIDSLFITAVLTVIGFSVHDTIVVFDRIRENLRKNSNVAFSTMVNDSIVQTMNRSLNTSFTTLLVLFTLFLFGGESVKWFVVALLIGILSGTYSSIFNAAPLLVVWEEWARRRKK